MEAGLESWEMSILPSPLKLKYEVSRSARWGKRKTRLQVLPECDEDTSKLKMVETVEFTMPLN